MTIDEFSYPTVEVIKFDVKVRRKQTFSTKFDSTTTSVRVFVIHVKFDRKFDIKFSQINYIEY